MTEPIPSTPVQRLPALFIVTLLAGSVALLLGLALPTRWSLGIPLLEEGRVHLSPSTASEVIALDGEWTGVRGKTLSPAALSFAETTKLIVPQSYSGESALTYRIVVSGLYTDIEYGLFLLETASAARVYADGRLMGATGASRPDGTMRPSFIPTVFPDLPRRNELEIVIQVENEIQSKAGLWQSVYFGPRDELLQFRDRLILADALLIGVLLVIAIFHLILALIHPMDGTIGGFAIVALLVAIKALLSGQHIWLYHLEPVHQLPWIRIAFIALTLGLPTLLWYTQRLFRRWTNPLILRTVIVAAVVQTGLALLLPFATLQRTFVGWHILSLLVFAYIFVITARAIRAGEVGAKVSLVGFGVLFGFVLNDILFDNNVLHTAYLLPIGEFGFILAQATMLSLRFNHVFEQTVALREGLEDTVAIRTRELQAERNRMQRLARHDELTELVNRRYGAELLTAETERFRRYRSSLAIILADIDHFKEINDTRGHQVGDETLRGFAEILHQTTRSTDTACRWGGEEFLLILPNTEVSEAYNLAVKLKETLEAMPIDTRSGPITISFSAGVTGVSSSTIGPLENPDADTIIDALLRTADIGLYDAKRDGRNRVRQTPTTIEAQQ